MKDSALSVQGASSPCHVWGAHPRLWHLQRESSGETLQRGGRGKIGGGCRLLSSVPVGDAERRVSDGVAWKFSSGGRMWCVMVVPWAEEEEEGVPVPRQTRQVYLVCAQRASNARPADAPATQSVVPSPLAMKMSESLSRNTNK